jgi:hypothetical protein
VRQWVEAGPMKLLCEFGVVDQEVAWDPAVWNQ